MKSKNLLLLMGAQVNQSPKAMTFTLSKSSQNMLIMTLILGWRLELNGPNDHKAGFELSEAFLWSNESFTQGGYII